MFGKMMKSLFPRKSKFISVISLNDTYLQTTADIANALGQNVGVNVKRPRGSKRMFVLDFNGDVMATGAHGLSQEITAVIAAADPKRDRVLVKVESPGGAVHAYGYASSQINRLKAAGLKTVVSVDKVAASGGYMMACVADKVISAPFAILGSIGVVAEFANFNKIITDLGVDYKQYTAGKYKRTVSTMAPITKEAESKFQEDLKDTYGLFKEHIKQHRPGMDIDELATGEHWYGSKAKELGLVDEIKTSDEYILDSMREYEVLKVVYMANKPFGERVRGAVVATLESVFMRFVTIYNNLSLS